jgi:hypothetical protein
MSQTFIEFIKNSTLSKEDKDFWLSILGALTEDQIKIFNDFADGKEENLKILTENIKAKKQAFENQDERALEEIIKGEQ